jgi:beta-N-acetylhexosaminidase
MKMDRFTDTLPALLCSIGVASAAHAAPDSNPLDDGWKKLTLQEKIGQTVIEEGKSLVTSNLTDARLTAYLKKYPVGGVFEGGGGPTAAAIADRVGRLRKASSVPLIICSDMESGAGANAEGLTQITSLTGLGATRSKSLAYDFGKTTALEARSIGVNWLFTPVSDLVQNPFNYLVADRSVSDKPAWAIPLLISVMHGYQDNGIAATAKHFPGDGVDYRNQHLTTSCNALTKAAWEKNHGAVFQKLINKGVMTIMVGHISLPCFQEKSEFVDGRYLPATLSYDLTTKLLKQKMGFKGVAVSDALMMGGFIKFYGDDVYVRCFQAGVDMLLWPPEHYYDDMEKAIQSGRIPMSRLDDAVQRIWRLKQQLGLLNHENPSTQPLTDNDKSFVEKAAEEIAEKSITLVRNRNHLLPLNPSLIHRVAIIPISNREEVAKDGAKRLQSAFSAKGIPASIHQGLWLEDMPKVAAENDLIVYLVAQVGLQSWGGGTAQQDTWTSGMAGGKKTIVVSLDNPFHSDEFIAANTYINAYGASDAVIAALMRGLFGEIPFTGQSPVDLSMTRKFDLDGRAK